MSILDQTADLESFRVVPPSRKLTPEQILKEAKLPDGTSMIGPDGLLIPPARSFSMIVNSATRIFSYRFDEAMRDNFVSARAMRRDAFIRGLMEERILPTINRRWHLEIDDDRDPDQRFVRDSIKRVLENIRDFDAFKRALLDAVWYGRAGCQWGWHRDWDNYGMWSIGKWDPVHGDSIQPTFDGVPAVLMDTMTSGWYAQNGADFGPLGDIRPTDRGGWALVLQRPYWRDRFAIHKHILEKADFFEGELAGSVQGLGIRGLVYWQYVVRTDALTWMLAYMQAVGQMDLLCFNYPAGNAQAKLIQEQNANKVIGKAAIVCPRNPNGNWPAVEQIPMNSAGLKAMHELVADYFDRHIERLIVGQSMSSGADKGTGLGGTGRAEFTKATKDEILIYDTNRLDETITYDLIKPIKRYNFPWATFPVRFKSVLPDLDAAEKVESGLKIASQGVSIKVDELREAAKYTRPEPEDEVIGAQPPAPPGGPAGTPPGAPGAPPNPDQPTPFGSGVPMPAGGPSGPPSVPGGPAGTPFSSWKGPVLGPTLNMGSPGGSNTFTPSFGGKKKANPRDHIGFTRYERPPSTQYRRKSRYDETNPTTPPAPEFSPDVAYPNPSKPTLRAPITPTVPAAPAPTAHPHPEHDLSISTPEPVAPEPVEQPSPQAPSGWLNLETPSGSETPKVPETPQPKEPEQPRELKQTQKARSILKAAEAIPILDEVRSPRIDRDDLEEIEEHLSRPDRREFEAYISERASEAADDYIANGGYETEIDRESVADNQNVDNDILIRDVMELVSQNGGTPEQMDVIASWSQPISMAGPARSRRMRLYGEQTVDDMIERLQEAGAPETVLEAVQGFREEVESLMQDGIQEEESNQLDSLRDDYINNYDDSSDREEWLQSFYDNNLAPSDDDESPTDAPLDTWYRSDEDQGEYRFQTSGGRVFVVKAQFRSRARVGEGSEIYIAFSDDEGSYGKTGKGESFEIFSKVAPAVTAIVLSKKPALVTFSAAEEAGENERQKESRKRLYDKLVLTVASVVPGYGAVAAGYGYSHGADYYFIYKKEFKEELESEMARRFGDTARIRPLVSSRYARRPGAFRIKHLTPHIDPRWWTPEWWDAPTHRRTARYDELSDPEVEPSPVPTTTPKPVRQPGAVPTPRREESPVTIEPDNRQQQPQVPQPEEPHPSLDVSKGNPPTEPQVPEAPKTPVQQEPVGSKNVPRRTQEILKAAENIPVTEEKLNTGNPAAMSRNWSAIMEGMTDQEHRQMEEYMDEYAHENGEQNYQQARRDYLTDFFFANESRYVASSIPKDRWFSRGDGLGSELYFQTSNGEPYRISAFPTYLRVAGSPVYEMAFADKNGSYDITGAGSAFEVFRKAIPAIVAYTKHYELPAISFSAKEPSRQRLYDKLVENVAASVPGYKAGYITFETSAGTGKRYYIYKGDYEARVEQIAQSIIGIQEGGQQSMVPIVSSRYSRSVGPFVHMKCEVDPLCWTIGFWHTPETPVPTYYGHRFCSTQVNLSGIAAIKILQYGQMIREDHLADDGREMEPHVTLRYGLHDSDPTAAGMVLAGTGPVSINLGRVAVFKGEDTGKDYDVIKVDVSSKEMLWLNRKLGKLPNTETFKYNPHATIAYVKKGMGEWYAKQMEPLNIEIEADAVVFSDTDSNKTVIPLLNPVTTYHRRGGTPYEQMKKKLSSDEIHRAREVDLVVLPSGISGKNCGNCKYGRPRGNHLYCDNTKVRLPVTEKMGCSLWDASGVRHTADLERIDYRRPMIYFGQPGQTALLPVPVLTQKDNYSCGANDTMAVGRGYYGVGPDTIQEWKHALGTTVEHSTPPPNIVRYLRHLGLQVEAKHNMTIDDLKRAYQEGKPVICCVQDYGPAMDMKASFDYGHYLVVIGVGMGYVFVMDSSEKNVLKDQDSLSDDGNDMIREDIWMQNWHDRDQQGNKYTQFGIIVGPPAQKLPYARPSPYLIPSEYDAAHAPPGGVTIGGKFYRGGQFIPGEVMAKASPEERQAVESGESRHKPLPPNTGIVAPKIRPRPEKIRTSELPEHEIVNGLNPNSTTEEKVQQLVEMSRQNKPVIDEFLRRLDATFGTESKSNEKLPERIISKSQRPSLKAQKPWFDVDHIRDSLRFKTILNDITELPAIIQYLEKELGAEVVKKDTEKFLNPKEWGFRICAFDLKMPNGQLVEYYLPVKELEEQKKPNHVIFEKWRNRDMSQLTPDELREYEQDRITSRSTYQDAFNRYLSRTGNSESAVRAALANVSASSGGTS